MMKTWLSNWSLLNYVPYVFSCPTGFVLSLCALVPLVPRTPYDPMSLVPCVLRALVFHCLTCLMGLVSYELSCLECLAP